VKEVTTTTPGKEVAVPTNDSLWTAFKAYFNTYYPGGSDDCIEVTFPRADQPIENVATFWPSKTDGTQQVDPNANILTNTNSEYKWLGDYIVKVATEQGVVIESEAQWRYNLWAFFNCSKRTSWPVSADFSEAGKPEKWGPAYQVAHGGTTGSTTTTLVEVELPSKITGSPYTIPTPVKDGDTFVGWYDNNNGIGTALTVLPVGYDGTVYAIWKSMTATTDIENVRPALDINAPMYDIMGRRVDATYRGIIIQNGNKYLLR
jgi:uncharacterized repeat protein (TIGR02543 family)